MSAARSVLGSWALAIGLLLAARALSLADPSGLLAGNLAGVAAVIFILVAERALRARGQDWAAAGFPWWGVADRRTWAAWGRGAAVAAGAALLVFPVFAAGFWAFAELLPRLPSGLSSLLAPYAGAPVLRPRLPPGLALQAPLQLLVVALPEELFYRGYAQTALAGGPGRSRRLLGATLGPGFLLTQLLFAAGHLSSFQVWRLGTFFPALLFGWLRARTGNLAAAVIFHALSNVFLRVLEASFYAG